MEKAKLNYIVDALMTISFIITAITGVVIFLVMPSGVPQGRYQVFLGIQKHYWTAWHNWSGIIMLVLVLLHLVLHWRWIVCMTKSMFVKKQEKCDTS